MVNLQSYFVLQIQGINVYFYLYLYMILYRTTHIMEAQARLWAVITERTKEGGLMHRLYNLELQRDVSPTFSV